MQPALFLGELHGLPSQGEPDAPGICVHRGPQSSQARELARRRTARHVQQLHGLTANTGVLLVYMSSPSLLPDLPLPLQHTKDGCKSSTCADSLIPER